MEDLNIPAYDDCLATAREMAAEMAQPCKADPPCQLHAVWRGPDGPRSASILMDVLDAFGVQPDQAARVLAAVRSITSAPHVVFGITAMSAFGLDCLLVNAITACADSGALTTTPTPTPDEEN